MAEIYSFAAHFKPSDKVVDLAKVRKKKALSDVEAALSQAILMETASEASENTVIDLEELKDRNSGRPGHLSKFLREYYKNRRKE